MRPKIAVATMRINPSKLYSKEYVLEPGIPDFLHDLGCVGFYICPGMASPDELINAVDPELILLTGGNDLVNSSKDPANEEREIFETSLLNLAARKNIPTVGICRGFQLMNQHEGGEASVLEGHVGLSHKIHFNDDEESFALTVNSFHAFGIKPPGLSNNFTALATAEDGTVEAALHKSLPFLGVMWHPERDGGQRQFSLDLITKNLLEG